MDGTLPAYDYSWKVDFVKNGYVQPSYYAEIPGPFYGPVSGETADSITIPSDVSQTPDSYYRITLTVTDSAGAQTVVTKDLTPNTTSWSVTDSVPGAGYSVDGAWHTGNYTAQDVVGVQHVLTGLGLAQTVGGVKYRFSGWGDGSALTDSFTSAAAPATYTGRLRRRDRHHAGRLDKHRHRRADHRGDRRLRGVLAELLPRRGGGGRVRRERPVALRLPGDARGRVYRRPGAVPDQLLAVGQGRPDDQAVDGDRSRLGGRPGGRGRAVPPPRTSTASGATPTAASPRSRRRSR